MKDITKGDLLEAIDSLAPNVKSQKRQIARAILPDIQNWVGGTGSVVWKTKDGRLEVVLSIRRTEEYQGKVRRERDNALK